METVIVRPHLLCRCNTRLLLLLLFLLLNLLSEFNSINSLMLCDAKDIGKADRVANEEGDGDERQSTVIIDIDEKRRSKDGREGERGAGRRRRGGPQVVEGLPPTESLTRELVAEKRQTCKSKPEQNLTNIKKKQLRGRRRIRRGNEADIDDEDESHHDHDKTVEHEAEHHERDTSHKEHEDDHHDDAHSWKYYGVYGPSNWSVVAPDCSSDRRRQTPIDIQTTATELDETMTDISLTVTDPRPDQKVTMLNNGHTVNVVFDNSIRVSGGKLENVFRVAGVHFHWGSSNYTGSEHTINGERFPLEMHIVSYDEERFNGLDPEVLSSDNSLAVLGVLFTISEDDNPAIEPIVSNLMNVQAPATSTSIPYFDLRTLLPHKYRTRFYRYFGSLTTPPCSEVVIWTVFKHTQNISHAQVARFRELYEAKTADDDDDDVIYLRHNWRPLQPMHGRTVVRSFLDISRRIPHPPPAVHVTTTTHMTRDHNAPAAAAADAKATAAKDMQQQSESGCNCQRDHSSSDGFHSCQSTVLMMLHSSLALLTVFFCSTS